MVNNQKYKIGLVVDDICSLPEKIIEGYQIEIVKTKLFFQEWEKFPEKNLYQIMRETRAHPKTSAPSPGDYLKAYKKALERFEKVEKELGAEVLFTFLAPPIIGANSGPGTLLAGCLPAGRQGLPL